MFTQQINTFSLFWALQNSRTTHRYTHFLLKYTELEAHCVGRLFKLNLAFFVTAILFYTYFVAIFQMELDTNYKSFFCHYICWGVSIKLNFNKNRKRYSINVDKTKCQYKQKSFKQNIIANVPKHKKTLHDT